MFIFITLLLLPFPLFSVSSVMDMDWEIDVESELSDSVGESMEVSARPPHFQLFRSSPI